MLFHAFNLARPRSRAHLHLYLQSRLSPPPLRPRHTAPLCAQIFGLFNTRNMSCVSLYTVETTGLSASPWEGLLSSLKTAEGMVKATWATQKEHTTVVGIVASEFSLSIHDGGPFDRPATDWT